MLVPLPPLVASAMAALKPWPVTAARRPLHYLSLAEMERIRAKESPSLSLLEHTLPASPLALLEHFGAPRNDFATVAIALLYLNYGYPDECHCLVTPYSWHDDTSFGGPPVVNSPAVAQATYVHCLLHRWEGSNIGELGMPGYSNANYWGKAANARREASLMTKIRHAIEDELLFLHDDAQVDSRLLEESTLGLARAWFQDWITKDLDDAEDWEPRALTELCKRVEANPGDSLAEFCAHACRIESRVIKEDCWEKAGYCTVWQRAGPKRHDNQGTF